MPTYSYRCASCGHQFDIFQKFSDNALTECPECHGQLKKVLHPVGVVFKGSGWYITDSRKPSGSDNGGSEKSEKSDKTEKSDAKAGTDTKASEPAKSSDSTDTAKPKAAAASES